MTTTEHSYATTPQLSEALKKYQNTSALIAIIFLGLLVAGYFIVSPVQFFRSYLVGFWICFGAGAGSLLLLMTQYLTGGAWGLMIRRPLEAGAKTLYVTWAGFLPLLLGVHQIYWWTTAEGQMDKRILAKSLYLNVPFLWARWGIYTVVFVGLTYLLTKWSALEEETKSVEYSKKLEAISGPGVVFYFILMTFLGVDYLMSLEPHWFSTIFGFMTVVGQGLTALCLMVTALLLMSKYAPMDHAVTSKHLHDLGKLMLAFTMLWAYLHFGQLLITWSGNLPDEVIWYIKRWNSGWGWVAIILLVFGFFVPFAFLLSQPNKKNPDRFIKIAMFIIVMRMVDIIWLVEPNFTDVKNVQFNISWMDVAAPIGFGGLWLALFFWNLPQRALLPTAAPDFLKAFESWQTSLKIPTAKIRAVITGTNRKSPMRGKTSMSFRSRLSVSVCCWR